MQFNSDILDSYNNINMENVTVSYGYNGQAPVNVSWEHGNSTWHHIIPRNELQSYLQNIGNCLNKISRFHVEHKGFAYEEVNGLITFGDTIGFVNGAPNQKFGRRYYWIPANGFLGPRSDNRLDDPRGGREKKPPYNFPSSQWNDVFQWTQRLKSLSSYINKNMNVNKNSNNELFDFLSSTFKLSHNAYVAYDKLLKHNAYVTDKREWSITGIARYSLI